jgi:hypothetical protein
MRDEQDGLAASRREDIADELLRRLGVEVSRRPVEQRHPCVCDPVAGARRDGRQSARARPGSSRRSGDDSHNRTGRGSAHGLLARGTGVANDVGLDFVLGAFAAGLVVGLALDSPEGQGLAKRGAHCITLPFKAASLSPRRLIGASPWRARRDRHSRLRVWVSSPKAGSPTSRNPFGAAPAASAQSNSRTCGRARSGTRGIARTSGSCPWGTPELGRRCSAGRACSCAHPTRAAPEHGGRSRLRSERTHRPDARSSRHGRRSLRIPRRPATIACRRPDGSAAGDAR